MWVSRLSLTNFRNYLSLELDLAPELLVFQGENAQGKSNLLEALYFLATARSPRTTEERELVHWTAFREPVPVARLYALVYKGKEKTEVEIALRAFPSPAAEGEKSRLQKRLQVNGTKLSALEFIGHLNAVLFSAQDIDILSGAPALRRRYLDIASSQVDPRYLRTLQHYQRVLQQRNSLLRLLQERSAQPKELDYWDQELVEAGSYLTLQRQQLLATLESLIQPIHLELTEGQEELKLLYQPSLGKEAFAGSLQTLREAFHSKLRQAQEREIALGMTLIGPHRDDMQFLAKGIDMGIYGSRGQQRTLALSLRLAEGSFMLSKTGEPPLLLLDDIFSELDSTRRRRLWQALRAYQQVFLTTTDSDRLDGSNLPPFRLYQISQANIQPKV